MQLQKQLGDMAEKLQITLCDIAHRENLINEYEDTIDSLNQKIAELKEQIGNLDKIFTSDMSPTELDAYKENVRILTETISNLDSHMTERKECILENSKSSDVFKVMGWPIVTNGDSARSSLTDHEEEIQNKEKYINKQIDFHNELKTIKDELAQKEDLRKKIFENIQLCSFDAAQNEATRLQDHTETIEKLEKEKKELEDLLRNKNSTVSVKLAEERRKRVNQLEAEINDMRKKNKHQAQLLKQREKECLRIGQLNKEIQETKQLKVKLIRKMRAASEEFRQERLVREKELTQLRAKDRKMQSEVAKKDMLHEKQRNVLKRKVEEANAATKRYKEALQRLKNSKAAKPNGAGGSGNLNKSASWLNEEIELITSIVDMKQSSEQLMEVRAELNARLNALEKEKPLNKEQIKLVKEEIEMRQAQINDLASKINENDLVAKSKQIYDGVHSLPESRSIIKHLLNNVVDQRNNFNLYFAQARDQKNMLETCEERIQQLEQQLKATKEEMRQKCNQMEKEHEEKTAVLLKALTTKEAESAVVSILEERLAKKDDELRKLLAEKNTIANKRMHSTRQRTLRDSMQIDIFSDEEEEDEYNDDDNTADPDFRGTPMYKREREPKRRIGVSLN